MIYYILDLNQHYTAENLQYLQYNLYDLFYLICLNNFQFFINSKIPRAERIKCPVMVSNGRIIWLVGYRIDDSVKVTPNTQKLLKAEVLLA